jgi:thioesterase domain-containing protein
MEPAATSRRALETILQTPQSVLPHVTILRPGGAAGSVWCLPGSDGHADIFGNLAPYLPADCTVYGIGLTELHDQAVQLSIESIAASGVRAVRSRDHSGPVHLLGYSFGGLVAYEMARQLLTLGLPVGFLGMVDTSLVSQLPSVTSREARSAKIQRKLITWLRHLRTLVAGPRRARWFRETVVSKLFAKAYTRRTARGLPIPKWLRNVNDLNIFASTRYRPPPYAGRVVLIRARDEFRDSRWTIDLGWRSVQIGDLKIHELPGTHRDLIRTGSALLGHLVGEYLTGQPRDPNN